MSSLHRTVACVSVMILYAASIAAQAATVPAAAPQPPPPPATKLEGFRPAAGTVLTIGYGVHDFAARVVEGRDLYVDRLRARVIDSITVEVWTSWEFTKRQTLVDKPFNKMVSLNRLDCKATRSMQIESNFYLGSQFQVHVEPPAEQLQWTNAPPQSVNETLLIRGCLIARGQPTEPVK